MENKILTPEDLLPFVRTEADNLKKHATAEELARLDFVSLVPHQMTNCIYGQMTGFCYSDRATELIKLCCKKTFSGTLEAPINPNTSHTALIARSSSDRVWSPIEVFIATAKVSQQKRLSTTYRDGWNY